MRELERDLPTPAATLDRGREGLPAVTIIGPGRVGASLARAAAEAGLQARLAGREDALEAAGDAKVALLCVPDTQITPAAEAIAPAVPPLRFVGHVSGATGLDALAPCVERGAVAFSLHPLQTVPDAESDLRGAPCAIAGTGPDAEALARSLAERLGMRPFAVPEEHRAAYHAAAVIASNFLVALEESAAELLAEAGVDDARALLAPLVLRAASNGAERGGAALTGPIARGDAETVARHLEAIDELAPELRAMYEALAERTAVLAARESGSA
jgi:predicted short-subunit dehydrogenase-like oxidoreductase (DUF2520 family)